MGSSLSRVIAAASVLLFLASGASLLAAIWLTPWWAWLATSAALFLIAAAFGTWADSRVVTARTEWMVNGDACRERSSLNRGWACSKPSGHTDPHHYVKVPA